MISAFAAYQAKEPLKPFTYPIPTLGPFELLVDVAACGVCHSDVSLIDNEWSNSIYPLVAGHEVVGTVSKIGPSVSKKLLGARVGVGWQRSSCMHCPMCTQGDQNVCADKILTCLHRYGGFGKTVLADSRFVYPIPDALPSNIAAPLLCAGATVFSPLFHANLPKGTPIAILGIGGLGHLALQFAKQLGLHVTALSSSPHKREEALSFGADTFALTSALAGKERLFPFILSTYQIGKELPQVLQWLTPFGKLALVTREEIALPTAHLISFQRSIQGSTTASPKIMQTMLEFAARHGVKPKLQEMPFSDINTALDIVRQGKARYRIVLS